MSHKRNEALRHVQHSMHHVIAAGEGSDPYFTLDFADSTLPVMLFRPVSQTAAL